jgi:hypothetical protein
MKKSAGAYLRGSGRSQSIGWNTHIERCPWCRKGKPTRIEFYGLAEFVPGRGWRLVHPTFHGEGLPVVCVVSHPGCGPDVGYAVPLDDIARDPTGWYSRVWGKTWGREVPLKDVVWDLLLLHRKTAYAQFRPPHNRRPAIGTAP